jgi:RNA polymerase sigma factor (sigma-70 family)
MLTREERFNRLHERHFEAIRRYAFRRAPALADDIVSESFLVAWRRIDDVPDDERPWLFGVARHVRLNLQRSSRRQHALTERLTGEIPTSAPGEVAVTGDALSAALSVLSDRDREILLLHAWEELNRREIAAVLGCSVTNVSVRLHRARARLAPVRQRFTVAHELGHFLLSHHDHFHIDLSDQATHGNPPGYNWQDERAANDFAAAVLMPSAMVVEYFESDRALEKLARRLKVSREAMGWRLVNLGLLD